MDVELASVETAIGYSFVNREWLVRAMTHSSHRGEAGLERVPEADNEQLEFLGDAVLGLIVSEHLFLACPDFDEGRLSNVKSRLVNRAHLADVARSLDIGNNLLMGRGEALSGGREKASLLANALEALLGAIYLDGGLDGVRQVVLNHIVAGADVRALAVAAVNNIKTSLEIMARSKGLPRPEYTVRAENSGFPQMFIAEVRVGKDWRGGGRASSKKGAETEAAAALMALLQNQLADG
jgi:ribonuclease-3